MFSELDNRCFLCFPINGNQSKDTHCSTSYDAHSSNFSSLSNRLFGWKYLFPKILLLTHICQIGLLVARDENETVLRHFNFIHAEYAENGLTVTGRCLIASQLYSFYSDYEHDMIEH